MKMRAPSIPLITVDPYFPVWGYDEIKDLIYLEAPVLDIRSWPAGMWNGEGGKDDAPVDFSISVILVAGDSDRRHYTLTSIYPLSFRMAYSSYDL